MANLTDVLQSFGIFANSIAIILLALAIRGGRR